MLDKFTYACVNCGQQFPADRIMYLCPVCSATYKENPPKGVLKTIYNYNELIRKKLTFKSLKEKHFIDLLPIKSSIDLPKLKIGNTPLYSVKSWDKKMFPFGLYLKDDAQNPTYSFKDRASGIVSAYAKENNLQTIIAASTGNAASSLAGICASQGQEAVVIVPAAAPLAKLTQVIMYGAKVIIVNGNYDDAFDLSVEATKHFGWYNRNTAFNPLTIEGKKTVSFELFDQLNETIPDRIFVPVGDGVILSGVYKGFEDLMKLEMIKKVPVIVAVQADCSDNLISNLEKETFVSKGCYTVADSIAVDYPRNFYMARDYLKKYKGEWIVVTDEEIIAASKSLSKNTGLFAEPASAAAIAGMIKYKEFGMIPEQSKNVVLLTGSGLKDIQAMQNYITIPAPIEPSILILEKYLHNKQMQFSGR